MNKVDLVMWTKNGERTLAHVLNRIDDVVPKDKVNRKIVIDDDSVDRTVEIAKRFSWAVYRNEKGGIYNAANQALEIVSTPIFASFEQDIFLCNKWFDQLSAHLKKENVIVAQGLRLSTVKCMHELQKYVYEVRGIFSVSIDNNLYKTQKIRDLGGFPKGCPTCTDTLLYLKINRETSYKWVMDPETISLHLKSGTIAELKQARSWMSNCRCKTDSTRGWTSKDMFRYFATSPSRAMHMIIKGYDPNLIWFYPCLRLVRSIGFLERRVTYET